MFDAVILLLATPVIAERVLVIEPNRQGPTAPENTFLRPPHPNSDEAAADIAVQDLRIDGDTLYVRVANKSRTRSRVPVLVSARAQSSAVKSEIAQVKVPQLKGGEARWVALSGFAFKTAAAGASPVFALDSAGSVTAAARLVPRTARTLDRSGKGCGSCDADADQSNNMLTLGGSAIKRGRPE